MENLLRAFDEAIKLLQEQKQKITPKNYHNFTLNIYIKRDLHGSILGPVVGFQQISPLSATITIENKTNLGKQI